ncbi:MAG TPA: hypothetical protein VMH84_01175 [Xanthobacteraceae bacterium]|nr:hypothetical protein [Xanthobacteraceae bacterium]
MLRQAQSSQWPGALRLAAVLFVSMIAAAQAADWKKYRGEFAGDGSDCIDFASIRTDAKGLTYFKWYSIEDSKRCGQPTQYDFVEDIAVSCREVSAAGPNRDNFPVKYYHYYPLGNRGWQPDSGPNRQFARVMQYVCQNRK